MSRLDAALERAATGAVVQQQAPRVEDLVEERRHHHQATDLETQSEHEEGIADVPPPSEGDIDAPRFRAFNRDYVEKLIVSAAVPPSLREQYRRLAATLHRAQEEGELKTVMITSAVPDEGKTLTATNIALTLSESYQRKVLLIDADLRRPSLDDVFQVPKAYGLNEALTNEDERRVSLIQVSRTLSLLTAGAPDPDPMSTLTGERMRKLLQEAAQTFDWVIVDTPPVGILTDAKLLASMVDATVMVIRANKTPAGIVQRAVDAIGRNRILGVVLNRAERKSGGGSDYYYSASYYYSGKKKKPYL